MSSRPAKRYRAQREGGSSLQLLPSGGNDYSNVHVLEARVHKANSRTYTAPTPVTTHQSTEGWRQATSWDLPDDPNFALDIDAGLYEALLDGSVMDEPPVHAETRKTRSKVSRRPHVVWKETYRQSYLDELVRTAGRGDYCTSLHCPDCKAKAVDSEPELAEYRCFECLTPDLTCKSCCIRRHRSHPLHRIEKWNGTFFEKVSLKSIGLRVQLNHNGPHCSNAEPCHQDLVVLHTNGFHEIAFDFCGCTRAIPQHVQLLRRRFYPASQKKVLTCASFDLLDLLHKLAVTTKASTYDFYRGLEQLTDGSGLMKKKYRYRALLRMVLQWRHLKMLLWGGRAHAASGAAGTSPGELAIRCPSCPYPGINLPEDWESAPPEFQFLYLIFVCLDANFRLKNQLVSNYSQDPGLGTGWAYLLPREPYEKYVLSRTNDTDISSCVGFQAIAQANNRFSKGLRYTGVGGAFCGRSDMVLPNGIGNLHKGERYSNMDYIFGSAIRTCLLPFILVSYDICCQWFVNLATRIAEHWPEDIQPSRTTAFIPAIPKLHEPMHQVKNHQGFSLNCIPGVGNSDLESPERFWAGHNAVGNSTKTQGPGSRQDVLDDHFNFWNWLKYIGIGIMLMIRYRRAIADRNIQTEAHRGLTEAMDPEAVKEWEAMCVDWESENFPKTKKNPYEVAGIRMTEAQAKKELAEDEERRLAAGGSSLHATSAPAFIGMALDLEDTQRRIRRLAKDTGAKATARQAGGLTEQRNQLTTRIRAWEQLLPLYLPGLLQYQADLRASSGDTPVVSEHPEDTDLWLPSRLPSSKRAQVCVDGLPEIEAKLRTAQCYDALETIRNTLKIKTRLVKFKKKNLRGQREGTCSRAVIDRIHNRARFAAQKYRHARAAKMDLSGPGEWENELKALADKDIRGYQDPLQARVSQGRRGTLEDGQVASLPDEDAGMEVDEETDRFELFAPERSRRDGTGQTRRTLSWIWSTSVGMDHPDHQQDDILRSEWSRSRARANRAKEEVLLVREEMRRTLEYLAWMSRSWTSRQAERDVSGALREALQAYAAKQAHMHTTLAFRFRTLWASPLAAADEEPTVSTTFPSEQDVAPTSSPSHDANGQASSAVNASESTPVMAPEADDCDDDDDDGDFDEEEEEEDFLALEDQDFNLYF